MSEKASVADVIQHIARKREQEDLALVKAAEFLRTVGSFVQAIVYAQTRHQAVTSELAEANRLLEEVRQERTRVELEAEERAKNSKSEGVKMLDSALAQAKAEGARIIGAAQAEAQAIKDRNAQIQAEVDAATQRVKAARQELAAIEQKIAAARQSVQALLGN